MDYDEYVKLGEINNDISESNKKPTRKSLKGNLLKRQLELGFKGNHLIKSKYLFIAKKILPSIQTCNLLFCL